MQTCWKCGKPFEKASELREHLRNFHQWNPGPAYNPKDEDEEVRGL